MFSIRVLGSAAGGGFPQWNCGCGNCRRARDENALSLHRTQECVAISADGDEWFLLNASPEIRAQIESFAPLHPRKPRHSPITGILLTNGDLDHTLGLLCLRESQPLRVYATECVRRGFTDDNVLYRTLQRFPEQVTWRRLVPGERMPLSASSGAPSGLSVLPIRVPGKPPVHLEGAGAGDPDEGVGLLIRDERSGKTLAYFSSFAALTAEIARCFEAADCVFCDGTFWTADELVTRGLSDKRAQDMAHVPITGPGGSIDTLCRLRNRRVLIHINNTNPILFPDAPEARELSRAGIEIAYDGMDVRL